MFNEYLDLLDYATSNNLIPDANNEDWGSVFNQAMAHPAQYSAFHFPERAVPYSVQTTLEIDRAIILKGAGSLQERGTVLKFKHQLPNTSNLAVGVNVSHSNVLIQGIYFGSTGIKEDSRVEVGLKISAPKVRIENCNFSFFEQKGIHILNTADFWYLKDVQITGSGVDGLIHSAVHIEANRGLGIAVNLLGSEGGGIIDDGNIGNTFIGCHSNQTTSNTTKGVYESKKGLWMGNYAEDNQTHMNIQEDAQLWNGHTGLSIEDKVIPIIPTPPQGPTEVILKTGTVLQARYEQTSFVSIRENDGVRFENHIDKPVFLTLAGRGPLTIFEFVALDDIHTQLFQSSNPNYLDYYENMLKSPYSRWRLQFDEQLEIYQWYFKDKEEPGMIFTAFDDFQNLENRHIGLAGYYMPLERSALFIGASSDKNYLTNTGPENGQPSGLGGLASLGSMIYNSNPTVLAPGATATDANYLGWLSVTDVNGNPAYIGVELLE